MFAEQLSRNTPDKKKHDGNRIKKKLYTYI